MFDKTISVSIIVSILTFLFLHFIIDPMKRKRSFKEERYKNFYAPLYSIIVQRVAIGENTIHKPLVLGGIKQKEYTMTDYMFLFIMERSGYASNQLLGVYNEYAKNIHLSNLENLKSEQLVKVIVKEYNQIKKELKLGYDKDELKTGIPSISKYKQLKGKLI